MHRRCRSRQTRCIHAHWPPRPQPLTWNHDVAGSRFVLEQGDGRAFLLAAPLSLVSVRFRAR